MNITVVTSGHQAPLPCDALGESGTQAVFYLVFQSIIKYIR